MVTPAMAQGLTLASYSALMALYNLHLASLQTPGAMGGQEQQQHNAGSQLQDVLLQVAALAAASLDCWQLGDSTSLQPQARLPQATAEHSAATLASQHGLLQIAVFWRHTCIAQAMSHPLHRLQGATLTLHALVHSPTIAAEYRSRAPGHSPEHLAKVKVRFPGCRLLCNAASRHAVACTLYLCAGNRWRCVQGCLQCSCCCAAGCGKAQQLAAEQTGEGLRSNASGSGAAAEPQEAAAHPALGLPHTVFSGTMPGPTAWHMCTESKGSSSSFSSVQGDLRPCRARPPSSWMLTCPSWVRAIQRRHLRTSLASTRPWPCWTSSSA